MNDKKRIILMGIGGQGRKAVHTVKKIDGVDTQKVYMDNHVPEKFMKNNEIFIQIPFQLEMDTWEPEYPIRYWLSEKKNIAVMDQLLGKDDIGLLVIVMGIGGEQTLVGKEVIRFCKKYYPLLKIYVVGSLPFRNQTAYEVNYISGIMVEYLRKTEVAYTIIENQALLHFIDDYETAYNVSHLYMVQILEGVLSMLYLPEEYASIIRFDSKDGIWEHPIYYLQFTMDMNASGTMILENPLLPMELQKGTGLVEIRLQGRLNDQTVRSLMLLHQNIEAQIGEIECRYVEGVQNQSTLCEVKIIGRGREGERRMKCRNIELFTLS